MATRRRLARTSRILGLPITRLRADEVRGRDGLPIRIIADADRFAAVLLRLGDRLAAGTTRTYRPFLTAWWSLCERREAELDDAALLRGWLRAMTAGEHAWSAASARVAMSAVTALLGLLDLPAPLGNHGFKTWFDHELLAPLAAPPVRKAPVLRRHLAGIVARTATAAAGPDPAAALAALRDRALILLGFSAALRRSELAAVRVEDLVATVGGGQVLRIRRSKTDRARQGQTVPIYPAADRRLDALAAIAAWRSAAGVATGPLFRRIGRHGDVGTRAISPSGIRLILRRYRLGADISPHSLRRGFITEARLAGASNVQIRRVSRHKDDRMLDTYTADIDAHRQGPGPII